MIDGIVSTVRLNILPVVLGLGMYLAGSAAWAALVYRLPERFHLALIVVATLVGVILGMRDGPSDYGHSFERSPVTGPLLMGVGSLAGIIAVVVTRRGKGPWWLAAMAGCGAYFVGLVFAFFFALKTL